MFDMRIKRSYSYRGEKCDKSSAVQAHLYLQSQPAYMTSTEQKL